MRAIHPYLLKPAPFPSHLILGLLNSKKESGDTHSWETERKEKEEESEDERILRY